MVVTFCLVNSAVAGWVTSGNNMYSDVNGNVGIGTSEPWCKLELIGSFRLTDAIVFGNNLGAANWQMWNEGPGKGPFWFPSFSAQDYDAKINLWDYTEPATSGHSLFVLAGGLTNVDMIIDGHFGVLGDLVVGNPGNWRMGNTGARKGPEWFGYFSNQDYDATMQIMDFADPAPTARSYLVVGGIHTDTDLIVDGRLGLFNDLVVGPSGETLFADVSTGNVGVGTATPSQKLHVDGYVRAKGYYTGDLFFQKDGQTLWRMYEDQAGLYVENIASGKKYDVVLRESGSVKSADGDTGIAGLRAENAVLTQRLADLEARLEALAKKLP